MLQITAKNADKHQLFQWAAWFLLGNIFFLWLIAFPYLNPVFSGIGSIIAPTNLNELDSNHPRFFVFIFFTFFIFTSYIAAFVLLPALACLLSIRAFRNKRLIFFISIITASITAFYLFIDSRFYSIYHFHLSGFMIPLIFGGDIQGLLVVSWLEWLYLAATVAVILAVETVFSWLISRYLLCYHPARGVKILIAVLTLFLIFSLQIFLYACLQITVARTIGISLLTCAGIYVLYQWKSVIVNNNSRFKILLAAFPFIILLLTFIIGAVCANFTPHQVIAFAVPASLLIAALYARFWTRLSAPVFALTGACCLLLYQMFVMEYVGAVRQVIETSYIFPFYDKIMLAFIPSSSDLSIYRISDGMFIQPTGINTRLHYPVTAMQNHLPAQAYNIVIIVIDTWRSDYLTAEVTPNIYQFATKSLRYQNHWSGGNSTQAGMFSLFYGLPASYWTAMLKQQRGPVLIHELLKNQYQTGIFSSSELAIPPLYKTIYLEIPDLKIMADGDTIVERDANINVEFKNFLNTAGKNKRPFFSVLVYDGAHGFCGDGNPIHRFQPELATCGRFALNQDTDPRPIINRYKNALYRIDGLVGEVLNDLTAKKLLNNTIVIITGDHGEEFNDNHLNYWEHANNFSRYQVQTPLVMYWPGKSPNLISSETTHFDIAPTLLTNALGYTNQPRDYSTGRDLFAGLSTLQYILAGSYNNAGIIETDRITTIMPDGEYEIRDHAYHPLADARLRSGILKQALNDMVRFYDKN